MFEKRYTCIICPQGCNITIFSDGHIEGNKCKRGEIYVRDEIQNPLRMLTTVIPIENGNISMCPVKTNKSIPKDKLNDAMEVLKKIKLKAPIKIGDIIVSNILNLGVDIISTRAILKKD